MFLPGLCYSFLIPIDKNLVGDFCHLGAGKIKNPSVFWSFLLIPGYDSVTRVAFMGLWFSGVSGSKGVYCRTASHSRSQNPVGVSYAIWISVSLGHVSRLASPLLEAVCNGVLHGSRDRLPWSVLKSRAGLVSRVASRAQLAGSGWPSAFSRSHLRASVMVRCVSSVLKRVGRSWALSSHTGWWVLKIRLH